MRRYVWMGLASLLALALSSCGGAPTAAPVAPGRVVGTETLIDAVRVGATGLVRVRRASDGAWSETVHARRGHFTAILPPGRYDLTGAGGDCPTVRATVRSRISVTVAIDCQLG